MPGLIRLDPTAMRLNRRRFAAFAAASVASVAMGEVATAQTSTGATPAGAEDAVALLKAGAAEMAKLKSFHFELTTPSGSASIMQGLDLKSIQGDVRRPADFKTVITASIPFGSIDVTVIGVDGQIWVQDPMSKNSQWISLSKGGGMDPGTITTFVNPDIIILRAVSIVHDAKITGHEKVGGVQTSRVDGQVSLAGLGKMTNTENAPTSVATAPIPVSIWIDGDNRIRELELAGQILTTESSDVVHDIIFSNFDQPVDIKAPV